MYHPTHITLRENHCGYAVELNLLNTPRDRNVFQVGVAAHSVLEQIGKALNQNKDITTDEIKTIANNTAYKLCSQERKYDGMPEAPMKMKQAVEGMRLALQYANYNPLHHEARYEEPFAFDIEWNETDYNDKHAAFRTLIDCIHIQEEIDEEGETYTVAIVRDYKTSWRLDPDMLDNLQRRAQALVVHLAYPHVDVLKMQIHGLRNKQKLERIIYVQHEKDSLEQWKEDITLAVKALKEPQIPNPGIGCYQCPYVGKCQHAVPHDKKKLADKYAMHLALAKDIEKQLREITKDAPIQTDKGTIGYMHKTRNTTTKDALQTLFQIWKDNDGTTEAFMQNLNLTATEAKKIIRKLSQNGLDHDTLQTNTMAEKSYSQFGISKTKPDKKT